VNDPWEKPIVILGGFLSTPMLYERMRQCLASLTGQPVYVAAARTPDWFCAVSRTGWAHLLQKLDRAVRDAAQRSPAGKVTLVGHSSGGVIGRLYLASEPFEGRVYNGLERVDLLVSLGSPHHNRHVGRIRQWVDQHYPGSYYVPAVRYVSVAGKSVRGDRHGSLAQRWAHHAYARLCGEGRVWGDGLVPVQSALLAGSQQITLEGVTHFGQEWYGSERAVARWWQATLAGE